MERPHSPPVIDRIRQRLPLLRSTGLWRERRMLDGPQGTVVNIDGREVINFSSNDYLGLANHPKLQEALAAGAKHYGVGSGASQLVCGYSDAHRCLEEKLCHHTGRDRALLFSSGYLANQAMVAALAGKSDQVIGDRLNHASLIDAALLSRARYRRYPHADVMALERMLETTGQQTLVTTDAVFSMDGDIAPLPAIVNACRQHNAMLAVDDAHGFAVLGERGGGTLEHFHLSQTEVPLLMATFGKALGTFGAFVAGDATLIEYLLQSARSLIYTTAPPPALVFATSAAIDLLQSESWRRQKLQHNIELFRRGAAEQGLALQSSVTAIQPLIVHDPGRAVTISNKLLEQGLLVAAIRPPTVPRDTSRLRIVLSAAHTETHITLLLDRLAEAL